jgi:hypothetical protein
MTIAREERSKNLAVALQTMVDAVGDSALDEVSFDGARYPSILTTTWDELLSIGLIEALPTGEYVLTGRGWTAGVLSTGRVNVDPFRERLQRLFAELKRFVKGRKETVTIPFRQIIERTGLPDGWVFNVIEGKYMEEISQRRGASWVKPGRLVLIPVSFGIEPTDLRTLLDPAMLEKMEDLENELESTREDLSQYKCPYCGSGLSAAGGYPIDEHNEGDYEYFSCGYGLRNGYPESLCPKDPEYPKLEDFELKTVQSDSGEWMCFPMGKTPKAKLVDIGACPGRTAEEARDRVAKRYVYFSGKKPDTEQLMR